MTRESSVVLVCARVAIGVLFAYAGVTKILNPAWSPAGYLKGADSFVDFYSWLLTPGLIEWVTLLNQWGLTLIGIALILGVVVRFASTMGIILMILYYGAVLNFPYVGDHSYIIDEHIIYSLFFLLFITEKAGRIYGLDAVLRRLVGQRSLGGVGKLYRSLS